MRQSSISLSSIIDEYNDSMVLSISESLITLAAFFPTKALSINRKKLEFPCRLSRGRDEAKKDRT